MQQKNQETITQTASLLHKRGRGAGYASGAGRGGEGARRSGVGGSSIDARPFTRLQCASPPAHSHLPSHAALVPQSAPGRSLLGKNGEMTFDIRASVSGLPL